MLTRSQTRENQRLTRNQRKQLKLKPRFFVLQDAKDRQAQPNRPDGMEEVKIIPISYGRPAMTKRKKPDLPHSEVSEPVPKKARNSNITILRTKRTTITGVFNRLNLEYDITVPGLTVREGIKLYRMKHSFNFDDSKWLNSSPVADAEPDHNDDLFQFFVSLVERLSQDFEGQKGYVQLDMKLKDGGEGWTKDNLGWYDVLSKEAYEEMPYKMMRRYINWFNYVTDIQKDTELYVIDKDNREPDHSREGYFTLQAKMIIDPSGEGWTKDLASIDLPGAIYPIENNKAGFEAKCFQLSLLYFFLKQNGVTQNLARNLYKPSTIKAIDQLCKDVQPPFKPDESGGVPVGQIGRFEALLGVRILVHVIRETEDHEYKLQDKPYYRGADGLTWTGYGLKLAKGETYHLKLGGPLNIVMIVRQDGTNHYCPITSIVSLFGHFRRKRYKDYCYTCYNPLEKPHNNGICPLLDRAEKRKKAVSKPKAKCEDCDKEWEVEENAVREDGKRVRCRACEGVQGKPRFLRSNGAYFRRRPIKTKDDTVRCNYCQTEMIPNEFPAHECYVPVPRPKELLKPSGVLDIETELDENNNCRVIVIKLKYLSRRLKHLAPQAYEAELAEAYRQVSEQRGQEGIKKGHRSVKEYEAECKDEVDLVNYKYHQSRFVNGGIITFEANQMDKFVDFMFSPEHEDFCWYAHNGGRFDALLVIRNILIHRSNQFKAQYTTKSDTGRDVTEYNTPSQRISIAIMSRHNRILQATVKKGYGNGQMSFNLLDSVNYFPTTLRALPGMFNFGIKADELRNPLNFWNIRDRLVADTQEVKLKEVYEGLDFSNLDPTMCTKTWYPHSLEKDYNKAELPKMTSYGIRDMGLDEVAEFINWYEEERKRFGEGEHQQHFAKTKDMVMRTYCDRDVQVLWLTLFLFHRLCYTDTEQHIIGNVTFSQFNRDTFLNKFVGGRKVLPLPTIVERQNTSKKEAAWLASLQVQGLIPHFVYTFKDGSKASLDGFSYGSSSKGENNTAYLFHGCYYHGCLRCHPKDRDQYRENLHKSHRVAYDQTMELERKLKEEGVHVISKWEHEVVEITDYELLNEYKRLLPIDQFESNMGGLCTQNVFYAWVDGKVWAIMYVDANSMYPYQMADKTFPSKPTRIVKFKGPKHYHHVMFQAKTYNGLVHCKILPARTGVPNLVVRTGAQNAATHCYTCAIMERDGLLTSKDYKCKHNEDERAHVITAPCIEVYAAIAHGDRILEVYEINHSDEMEYIFRDYINHVYDKRKEAKRAGNKGMDQFYKLVMNALSGKLGQRMYNWAMEILFSDQEIFEVLRNPKVDPDTRSVEDIYCNENKNIIASTVSYELKENETGCRTKSSPLILAYITAYSRCMIREFHRVCLENQDIAYPLYSDTDSVILAYKVSALDTLKGKLKERGLLFDDDKLGGFKSELHDPKKFFSGVGFATEFVCSAKKEYCLRNHLFKCPKEEFKGDSEDFQEFKRAGKDWVVCFDKEEEDFKFEVDFDDIASVRSFLDRFKKRDEILTLKGFQKCYQTLSKLHFKTFYEHVVARHLLKEEDKNGVNVPQGQKFTVSTRTTNIKIQGTSKDWRFNSTDCVMGKKVSVDNGNFVYIPAIKFGYKEGHKNRPPALFDLSLIDTKKYQNMDIVSVKDPVPSSKTSQPV